MSKKSKRRPSIHSVGSLTKEEKQTFVGHAVAIITEEQTLTGKEHTQVMVAEKDQSTISLVARNVKKKPTKEEIIRALHLAPDVEVEVMQRITDKQILHNNVDDFRRVNKYQPLNALAPAAQLAAIDDLVSFRKNLKLKKDYITISYILKYGKINCELANMWHSITSAEIVQLLMLLKDGQIALTQLEPGKTDDLLGLLRKLCLQSRQLSNNVT